MRNKAEINIQMDCADTVLESILPELNDSPSKRSKTKLDVYGNDLKICVWYDDVVMLRASLNTWLRLIKTAWDVVEILN